MTVLYVARDHASVLELWRARDARGLRLVHVDDHCDLRGLLVEPGAGRAAPTGDRRLRAGEVDAGNFLAHAVLEGRVSAVRWVWSRAGGRDRDVGTVRYTTDLSALPYRLGLRAARWRPFAFTAMREEQWRGVVEDGEDLDVDWDFFASRRGPREGIRARARAFLDLPLGAPARVTLAYSGPYCHPSEALFEELVEGLAGKLGAEVVRLPDAARPRRAPSRLRRARWRIEGWLRRELGVF